jgi:hypothetical protein
MQPTISFCTTCCNRYYQFRETYSKNIFVINALRTVEWVIINYNSSDEIHDFMMSELKTCTERVVYGRVAAHVPWHASRAKNLAHNMARGKILVNLDCDNYVYDTPSIIMGYFANGCRILHLWSGVKRDGTYGRIAIDRDLFLELGGYDESFEPMGYQDTDLLLRARALGNPLFSFRIQSNAALANTKLESVANCGPDANWQLYNDANAERSRNNIINGNLRANRGLRSTISVSVLCGHIHDCKVTQH